MNVWDLIILQPLTNVLIVVAHVFGNNFGVAIVLLTILVNLALLPLTLNQVRSAKKMQELQPKLAELQKKYGKDREKLSQEQMKLYKESGVKPAGCALTMIIQIPVWYAVYQSIVLALAAVPEGLLNLGRYLYPSWNIVYSSLPLSRYFLGMDLSQPNMILALLVGVTMWLQQKMSTTQSADPSTNSQNQMMTWMMPLLFTFMAFSFPSGLALYWVTSSLFRIIMQYRISGWGSLRKSKPAEGEQAKKYIKFDSPGEKKTTVKTKDGQVVITDNESSKKKFSFRKFFGQGEKDEQGRDK